MASIFFYILNKSGFSKNILKHSTVTIFIVAPRTSKIHLVSNTNKCTSISYINLK